MRACWMFMILVGCRLSHATESLGTCTCNDQLETVCVPAGASVLVPCPNLTAEDVKFNLFREEKLIHNYCGSKTCIPPHTRADVELHENTDNKSVSFKLMGVSDRTHGIYRCQSVVTFPPPMKRVCDLWILVLVEGHQCKQVCPDVSTVEHQSCGMPWHWSIIPVAVYGTIMTIIAIYYILKLRRTDSQSDYVNTKPKPAKDRRRKRGVQNPIPRHF